ncbi:MAG: hypothetical protein LUI14_07025 [Lachnospiraceae bacterium]|nr:hypothetical protein [Lachnospiraceae bacterium]
MYNKNNMSKIKKSAQRKSRTRIISAMLLTALAADIVSYTSSFGTALEVSASAEFESEGTTEEDSANTESEDTALSYDLVKSSSPAEFVENYYNYYIFTGECKKFWDDCVSQTTKDTEYTNRKDFDFDGILSMPYYLEDYNTIEITSVEELDEEITAVGYMLFNIADDEIEPWESTDYLIEENGEYKYLLEGLKSLQKYTVQTESLLTMDSLEVYTYIDRFDLDFDLQNCTDGNVYVGLVNGAAVTITMKDGSVYTEQLTEGFLIDSGYIEHKSCAFYDVAGEISSVMIEPVYMEDDEGLPDAASECYVTYTVVS